jgi:threonine dehydratase
MSATTTTAGRPDLADVVAARQTIAPHLRPTPLHRYPALDRMTGAEIWVKHENHLPTGAFKVRGGINLVAHLSDEDRRRGLITASTGNHGQSIAYAARLFGVAATICAPANANPVKVAAIRDLGATLILEGRNFDEAKSNAERLAQRDGKRYVHSGDEPLLIAGVATHALEIFDDEPSIDTVIVPLGGGSGAAGACIVKHSVRPAAEVIAVQSAQAPSAYRSWSERRLIDAPNETVAEGLATGQPFELPQQILWDLLDDFVLVDDGELVDCTAHMITLTRNLVEPAGAAPLAAAIKLRERIRGKRVALICSGGNISPALLKQAVARLD